MANRWIQVVSARIQDSDGVVVIINANDGTGMADPFAADHSNSVTDADVSKTIVAIIRTQIMIRTSAGRGSDSTDNKQRS